MASLTPLPDNVLVQYSHLPLGRHLHHLSRHHDQDPRGRNLVQSQQLALGIVPQGVRSQSHTLRCGVFKISQSVGQRAPRVRLDRSHVGRQAVGEAREIRGNFFFWFLRILDKLSYFGLALLYRGGLPGGVNAVYAPRQNWCFHSVPQLDVALHVTFGLISLTFADMWSLFPVSLAISRRRLFSTCRTLNHDNPLVSHLWQLLYCISAILGSFEKRYEHVLKMNIGASTLWYTTILSSAAWATGEEKDSRC